MDLNYGDYKSFQHQTQSKVVRTIFNAPFNVTKQIPHRDFYIQLVLDLTFDRVSEFHQNLKRTPNPLAQSLSNSWHLYDPPPMSAIFVNTGVLSIQGFSSHIRYVIGCERSFPQSPIELNTSDGFERETPGSPGNTVYSYSCV